MAGLQDLPVELLRYIFSFINGLDSLCHLTRVSRGFRTNAEPFLYQALDINQFNGDKILLHFVRTLLERPPLERQPLAKHVRTLSLAFWPRGPWVPGKVQSAWTVEDFFDYGGIIQTLNTTGSKSWAAGVQYGIELSRNDSAQYILVVALLSLVPGLQELHFEGEPGLSVPHSLIQKVAGVSWTTSSHAFLGTTRTLPAVSQLTDTIYAPGSELVSLSTAVTNIQLDGKLEELMGLPHALKSFSYLVDSDELAQGDVSPNAIVDILYQHHGQSLRGLTIGLNDRYVGWQDAETRLYRSTCLRNFTKLIYLKVKQHMLLEVQRDRER